MTFEALLSETATITHVGEGPADEYNMPTPAETTSEEPTFLEPIGGSEDTVLRSTGVADGRAYFLPTVTLSKNDRIEVAGRVFECVEPPEVFFNPRLGVVHHIEVLVKEVT